MVSLKVNRLAAAALLVWCATAVGCSDASTKGSTQMTAEEMKAAQANPTADKAKASPTK